MIWRSTRSESEHELIKYRNEYPGLSLSELQGRLKKRNALSSNFVLCRVLGEIVRNLKASDLESGLGKKLEDMVIFNL